MKFDDRGSAIQGSYPISTVSLGMWKADGTPVPTVESAVCHKCGGWASHLWVSGTADTVDTEDPLSDVRISRRIVAVVYACPEHEADVSNDLVAEFGGASNVYEADELAVLVAQEPRKYFKGPAR